jgi:undecaprenyl phosphate-alpha-L-ara4N flippase subunit ArnE
LAISVALTLASVVLVAIAQILFELAARRVRFAGWAWETVASWSTVPMGLALLVSAAGAGLWIWALRSARLSMVYPLYALTFVLVPLLDRALFATPLSLRYWIGAAIIVVGVWLMTTSGQ